VAIRDAFRADLLVERTLVIEVKSVERLAPVHAKQLLTYLRLMNQPLGLLMNFGADMFRDGLKRVINNRSDYVAPPGVDFTQSTKAPKGPAAATDRCPIDVDLFLGATTSLNL
jgi:hypothetical protein